MFFTIKPTRFVLVLSLAVPASAMAQQPHAGHAEKAGVTAPSAASAPAMSSPTKAPESRGGGIYKSAFEGYRGFSDEKPVPWREANDTVGHIGGWRAYAREAQGAEPPASAASRPGAATAPASRGGHGAHKQQ